MASRLLRLNRKAAWLLVLLASSVAFTGYSQPLGLLPRSLARSMHLVLEWLFAAFLTYHVAVGILVGRFPIRAPFGNLRRGRRVGAGLVGLLLGLSGVPLLAVSVIMILSGLSWYGIITLSFNHHFQYALTFVSLLILHTLAGGLAALGRRRRRGPATED